MSSAARYSVKGTSHRLGSARPQQHASAQLSPSMSLVPGEMERHSGARWRHPTCDSADTVQICSYVRGCEHQASSRRAAGEQQASTRRARQLYSPPVRYSPISPLQPLSPLQPFSCLHTHIPRFEQHLQDLGHFANVAATLPPAKTGGDFDTGERTKNRRADTRRTEQARQWRRRRRTR